MKLLRPTRLILVSLLLSACLALSAIGQTSTKCYDVRDLDFFVAPDTSLQWTEDDLKSLIAVDRPGTATNWMIPAIIKQLVDYYPDCNKLKIDNRFHLLVKLYSVIRKNNELMSPGISIKQKFEMVREDFSRQVNDDELFPSLIYTMDDGPFVGETRNAENVKVITSKDHPTNFGILRIANSVERVVITALDKNNNVFWSRILKGAFPERYLRKASLDTATVKQTDLAIVLTIFVDGEKLTLYTRPTGRFMYYTHSW